MSDQEARILHLWRFVRGDEAPVDFEPWVYAEVVLEAQIGHALYLEVISTDYSDKDAVRTLRSALGQYLRSLSGPSCMCVRLRDLDIVDMGTFNAPEHAFEQDREWSHEDVFEHLEEVKARGAPLWWLWAAKCKTCGQGWLVGQEERQNEVFCMRRLDREETQAIEHEDRWPTDFDTYESLLQLGLDAGRSVRFLDPEDSSLGATIADLARARPRISVSELATLLDIDRTLASRLARRAANEDGVEIAFDSGSGD